jgi:hypothetical protein
MKPKWIFWGVSYCARHETRDEGKQLAKWNNMWKRRKILGRAKVTQPSEPAGRHADLLLSTFMYPNYNLSHWSWSFYAEWTNNNIVLPMGSKTDSASARMLSLYLINKKVDKPLCCLVWCPWYLIVRSMLPDNEERTSSAYFWKEKYLEEYMVLNMKMGNGKVGRIEN